MKLPDIRSKIRDVATKENLFALLRLARRKVISAAGRAIMNRQKSQEVRMRPYTLHVSVDVDASSRDVIDSALASASGGAQGHSALVLDFLNLADQVKFCGVMVKVAPRVSKMTNGLRPFTINAFLYVEAPKKSVFDEGIALAKQEGESYAPAVLGLLGLGSDVKFRGIEIDVTKGHPA